MKLTNAAPGEKRWLLLKAWHEDVAKLISGRATLSGALLFEGSSSDTLAAHDGFYPVVLDLTWKSTVVPHLLFVLLLVAGLVGCVVGLRRLREEYKFPILTPMMDSLRVFANDGNPVSVMASINNEMQHNLQGTAAGRESDLCLTDSWILHVVQNDVEVAFFPDVSRIEPLYDFNNGGAGGGHLSGLQIFCRRGRDFFVPLTTEQYEHIQEKMQGRMLASEEIRRLETHTQQLQRLERLVREAGVVGGTCPLPPNPSPSPNPSPDWRYLSPATRCPRGG